MKNLTRILLLGSLIFAVNFIYAQSIRETLPIITVTGEEVGSVNAPVIETTLNHKFGPVQSAMQTFNIHNITTVATGYDFQSNACSQELWYDINTGLIHSIFTWSNETAVWSNRSTKYFFSGDQGVSWIELGNVPTDGARSGFPAISGLSSGAAVLSNHSAEGGTPTRAKIFIDNSPGEFNLTVFDPGAAPGGGSAIWPRVTVDLNDDVHLIASVNAATGVYYNRLVGGIFDGYTPYDGDVAESYSLAVSEGGKIGHAYKGDDVNNEADVFYRESTDNGTTWSTPLKIYDGGPSVSDTAFGVIRGPYCNFNGEEPVVVFEDAWQQYAAATFSPSEPNHVYFWSPNVNGGDPMVIADSSNTPWALNLGTNDVLVPFCRPVIGRTQSDNGYLFVAFMASTENVYPSPDTTSYFAGYFLMSSDGGNNWTVPEKFTPDGPPLLDWRYISIAPVSPVVGDLCTVHMVVQGDTIPGSTVNAVGMPVGVTAQYYHVSTEPITIPVELTSFTAQLSNNQVGLNWQTATETNNMGFEIQRKIIKKEQSGEWVLIGYKEGAGTTTEPQEYSYYDNIKNIEATSFVYRLKQVDYDGSYEFSNEVRIENSMLPDEFSLSQNYPNPFNPSTSIEFQLPVKSFVSLVVYDVLGNEVATLVKEEKPAGFYEVNFNANNLVSGVYIYRFQANRFTEIKKMILLR